jgi:RNA polymerase sigma-70 factor (ECF subfamily)
MDTGPFVTSIAFPRKLGCLSHENLSPGAQRRGWSTAVVSLVNGETLFRSRAPRRASTFSAPSGRALPGSARALRDGRRRTRELQPRPIVSSGSEERGPAREQDDLLVERARTGDRSAFKALFLAHRAQVARLVQRLVAANEVEDVSQEVFLHVHRSLASFRGESRFSTWLYRLTLNVTRMHVRKQQSRPKLNLAGDDEAGRLERVEPATPASEAERHERMAALRRLIGALSEKKQEALLLHDFEGLAAEEISKIVDAPVMTVRTRVFYARKELYAALATEPSLAHAHATLVGSAEPPASTLGRVGAREPGDAERPLPRSERERTSAVTGEPAREGE